MTIKAIETVYKGYRFRSRLEARWAVFFDEMGYDWEYESEGYELSDGTWYLPDFKIKNQIYNSPTFGLESPEFVFVEIKGVEPTSDEVNKAKQLCVDLDTVVYIYSGDPWEHSVKYFVPTSNYYKDYLGETAHHTRQYAKWYVHDLVCIDKMGCGVSSGGTGCDYEYGNLLYFSIGYFKEEIFNFEKLKCIQSWLETIDTGIKYGLDEFEYVHRGTAALKARQARFEHKQLTIPSNLCHTGSYQLIRDMDNE